MHADHPQWGPLQLTTQRKILSGPSVLNMESGEATFFRELRPRESLSLMLLDRMTAVSVSFLQKEEGDDDAEQGNGTWKRDWYLCQDEDFKLLIDGSTPMDCVVWQVSASKTKIYMVLEYVNGGELFDKIVRIMDLTNLLHVGRIAFASAPVWVLVFVVWCRRHQKVSFQKAKEGSSSSSWSMVLAIVMIRESTTEIWRWLIPLYSRSFIADSSFEVSRFFFALITAGKCACGCKRKHKDIWFRPQCSTSASRGMWFESLDDILLIFGSPADSVHQNDGLLHTTCGSPNYIAPEVT